MSSPSHDEKNSSLEEKGGVIEYVSADEKHHLDVAGLDQVQRRLKQRHVQMIAVRRTVLHCVV